MSYDVKCEELAREFLPDCDTGEIERLAQHIQDAIEDWLAGRVERPIPDKEK
jgi:hypothetical protein